MSAEFNWWLLLVGLVAGGALTWLVLADSRRRDQEIDEVEISAEAGWIARTLDDPRLDGDQAERVLRAHRRYLGFPPPDTLVDPAELATTDRTGKPAGEPGTAEPAGEPGTGGPVGAPNGGPIGDPADSAEATAG
jgi:hypothetical protein